MVARLKLKGIDGRAPPGVKQSALAPVTQQWVASPYGGKIVKLLGHPKAMLTKLQSKECNGKVERPWYGDNSMDKWHQP